MSNYKAIVAKIEEITPIKGADKICEAKVLNESVIVSKDCFVGMVGVFFCAGTQLSEEYCHQNNLFREADRNIDPNKKGFFEHNRRVRAQTFMGVKSEGYFASRSSLRYTGYNIVLLTVGTSFERLRGHNICNKYINPYTKQPKEQVQKKKENYCPDFIQHVNTLQFKHHLKDIPLGAKVTISPKLHGTSGRYGLLKVKKKLPIFKRLWSYVIGGNGYSNEYEYVVGTRRVILDEPGKEGFHGKEKYRFDILNDLKPHLTEGMTIYGEIVGFANGKPIMPKHNIEDLNDKEYTKKYGKEVVYTYNCDMDECKFYIYRITEIQTDGSIKEFTISEIGSYCHNVQLNYIKPLTVTTLYDYDEILKEVIELTERPNMLTEDYIDTNHISEGVIIRADYGGQTRFYKNKSYVFKVMEGIAVENSVDMEDES